MKTPRLADLQQLILSPLFPLAFALADRFAAILRVDAIALLPVSAA